MLAGTETRTPTSRREGNSSDPQCDAVEDQIVESNCVCNEVRAAVAQQRRDDEPKRLHRDEAQQARRADGRHDAVDEARRLSMQPNDGADRSEAVVNLVHNLHIERNRKPGCTSMRMCVVQWRRTFVNHMKAHIPASRGPTPPSW